MKKLNLLITITLLFSTLKISYTQNDKVGIGTTSPAEELHVKDFTGYNFTQGIFQSSNGSGGIKLINDANQQWEIQSVASTTGSNPNGLIFFDRSNLRYSLSITESGDVGIGTNSPLQKLFVNNGNIGTNGDIILHHGSTFLKKETGSAYGIGMNEYGSSEMSIFSDNLIDFRESDGSSLCAQFKLDAKQFDFYGDIDIKDQELYLRKTSGNTYGLGLGAYGATEMVLFADNLIDFRESDASALCAQFKLNDKQFNFYGKIEATEIKVTTSPGADFVFEEDYKLRSLTELEKFIIQHKHLPEIPSAKEMNENGYDIAELNAKLLQKIEELTIYVIELRKELDQLKTEIK